MPNFYKEYLRCTSTLNEKIMKFNSTQPIECNPIKAIGLNSYFLNMRHEMHCQGQLSLQARKERMLQRLMQDFLQEEKELKEVDLGYIETQP